MVLINPEGKITKYNSIEEILETFYDLRLKFYHLRKDYMISVLKKEIATLSNKVRFIKMLIEDELNIKRKKIAVLVNELYDLKFDTQTMLNEKKLKTKEEKNMELELVNSEEKEDNSTNQNEGNNSEEETENQNKDKIKLKVPIKEYDYLLNMNLWSLTQEKIDKLLEQKENKEKELRTLEQTEVETLWDNDLNALEEELIKYEKMEEENRLLDKEIEKKKNGSEKSERTEKSQKYESSEMEEFSRTNSKNEVDLQFLDEEEKTEEQFGDYNIYIQRANDEEEEFKIIYEFNKLQFKPKVEIIDLGIFDNTSIFKCIIKSYFDKTTQNFITKLFFIYVSDQSPLSNDKNITEKILDYFNERENENNKENIDLDIDISDENNNKNEIKEDIQGDENTIGITILLNKFELNKGKERNIIRRQIKLKKSKEFKEINDEIEISEKEDLKNYLDYHKIFYTLIIQKNNFIELKRSFAPNKIGIKNEGNTCYMNSIIQSLYNNPFMLKQIMKIDTEKNEILSKQENKKDKKVIIALQKIFYNLYSCIKPIRILDIFYAFNWKMNYWNSPQDAEEIYIMILEILSKYNYEIKNNCEVILENTIKAVDVNYESVKEENFIFLQLDIEKNSSVDECLEHFFEIEQLNGENKYRYINSKEKSLLCDAEKGYKFKKIPNFLFLQLKRFTFDITTFSLEKKNKAISFKEEMDLTKYFHNKNNNSKSKKNKDTEKEIYTLYSVLVHSGSPDNGHYYCIARDFQNKVYVKYNDTLILKAEKKEIFDQLFGGEEIEYTIENINKNKYKEEPWYEVEENKKERKRNVYLLIYAKKSEINNLFDEGDIKEIFDKFAEINKNKYNYDNDETTYYQSQKESYNRFSNDNNNINDIDQYKYKIGNNISNNIYDNIVFMFEKFDFNEISNMMKMTSSKKRNKKDLENKKNRINTFYNYKDNQTSDKQNSKKFAIFLSSDTNYKNKIIDLEIKYYLIKENFDIRVGVFLLEYNSKIFVRDVVPRIKGIMSHLKNIEEDFEILMKITGSCGYKLALVNSFGFFIKFLNDENEEITNLLNKNNPKELKHLCLYDFKKLKAGEIITNLIAVNFISKSLLNMILHKKDIYENYELYNINIPAFLINENMLSKIELINRIKDLYLNYFRGKAHKNVEFKIYIIKDLDIMNKDVTQIEYMDLNEEEYNFTLLNHPNNSAAQNKNYSLIRLLIGI